MIGTLEALANILKRPEFGCAGRYLGPNTRIDALDLDSLERVDFATEIDRHFGVEIYEDELPETLGELAGLIDDCRATGHGRDSIRALKALDTGPQSYHDDPEAYKKLVAAGYAILLPEAHKSVRLSDEGRRAIERMKLFQDG